jgi:chromate transporter
MSQVILLSQLFFTFAKLSLVSFGGIIASLSDIQHDVVNKYHWMSHADFIQLYALAQMAPGPNVTVVTLIGWQVAGLSGAITATLAILFPACTLTFFIFHFANHFINSDNYKLLEKSIIPIAIGLIMASGVNFALVLDNNWFVILVTLISLTLMGFTKTNPVWIVIGGSVSTFIANFIGIITI